MITAILPAAGRSQRMGRPKLLLPFGGSTVIGEAVDHLRQGGVDRIVVVTTADAQELRSWAVEHRLELATNAEPERGMLSSLWCALDALGGAESVAAAADALLVQPADMPLIRPQTIRTLLQAAGGQPNRVAVPYHGDKRGHPLVIGAARIAAILELDLARGLRQLLEQPEAPLRVSVEDPGILRDLDTPEQYARLLKATSPPGRP